MSLVGPRPERPELQKEIEKEVPEFGLRLQTKAGLTGYYLQQPEILIHCSLALLITYGFLFHLEQACTEIYKRSGYC